MIVVQSELLKQDFSCPRSLPSGCRGRNLLLLNCCKEWLGGMREWLKRAVLKTAVRETVPGVRIPVPPPSSLAVCFSAL